MVNCETVYGRLGKDLSRLAVGLQKSLPKEAMQIDIMEGVKINGNIGSSVGHAGANALQILAENKKLNEGFVLDGQARLAALERMKNDK